MAESARLRQRRSSREELPCVRGSGAEARWSNTKSKEWWPCRYRRAERSCSMLKIRRGGSWEEQPHVQGAVAAQAREGLEELVHV